MRGQRAAILLLVTLGMGPSSAASAAPRPPDVSFETSSQTEEAFLTTYCWGEYDPPLTYTECEEGDVPGGPARRVRGLDSVRFRIDHPQQPDDVELVYWRGRQWWRPDRPRTLAVTTRQTIEGSSIAWIVEFQLPHRWKHLSLELGASWDAEASCPTCGRQWAHWRVTLSS